LFSFAGGMEGAEAQEKNRKVRGGKRETATCEGRDFSRALLASLAEEGEEKGGEEGGEWGGEKCPFSLTVAAGLVSGREGEGGRGRKGGLLSLIIILYLYDSESIDEEAQGGR